MARFISLLVAMPIMLFALHGCNTMEGAGQDVKALGSKIEDTADRKKKE